MIENNDYNNYLEKAYIKADELREKSIGDDNALAEYLNQPSLRHPLKTEINDNIVPLGKTVAQGIETILSNLSQNKYVYSVLLTSLVEKLVHPQQDIRYHQSRLPGGYSNRNTDQIHVTPFLQKKGLTHSAASGLESGRNLERPIPLTLKFPTNLRGRGNSEAFLGILYAVEAEGVDPFPCMVLLMALDLKRQRQTVFEYPQPTGLTIQEIIDALEEHFAEAHGNGRARLPVLAIQAVYECLTPQLARYNEKVLLPPARHTANDKKGQIGDVQINHSDGSPFEGVEVKSEKSITASMVALLPRKFQGYTIDRYYLLSTNPVYMAEGEETAVAEQMHQVRDQTGCEIIVNGLVRTLWYYMRLISDKHEFLTCYTALIDTDPDVQPEHKELWSRILSSRI